MLFTQAVAALEAAVGAKLAAVDGTDTAQDAVLQRLLLADEGAQADLKSLEELVRNEVLGRGGGGRMRGVGGPKGRRWGEPWLSCQFCPSVSCSYAHLGRFLGPGMISSWHPPITITTAPSRPPLPLLTLPDAV